MRLTSILLLCFLSLCSFAQKKSASPVIDTEAEQEILRLVNLERARAGLSSLRSDPDLQKAARQHSRIMAAASQLSHEFGAEPPFSRRLSLAGASFDMSGENVAFNQTGDAAHRALMASPPHRKNILTPEFNSVGIGVIREGDNIWVTQDFTRAFEKQSEQEARNAVIAAFQQARRRLRLAPVGIVDEPHLHAHACRMAKSGELDSRTPLGWSTIRTATTYTETDLSQLPSTALKLAENPNVQRVSVGVCFDRSPKYESGMNWVVIAAY